MALHRLYWIPKEYQLTKMIIYESYFISYPSYNSNFKLLSNRSEKMILIAVLVPWLSFFLRGKILTGILCLILQITIIGWIPAAIWAVASRHDAVMDKKIRRMERRIKASQKN
jgi:uncharacterized membrane protein YqaE (UPF0057 family)